MSKTVYIVFLLIGNGAFAQSMSSYDYQKAAIASQWLKEQTGLGNEITQEQIDSLNGAFKKEKDTNGISLAETTKTKGETITKSGMPGIIFTVPAGKEWKVKQMFVTSSEGGYNIKVTSVKYPKVLKNGDKLPVPAYTAESALITEDGTSVNYIFQIEQIDIP